MALRYWEPSSSDDDGSNRNSRPGGSQPAVGPKGPRGLSAKPFVAPKGGGPRMRHDESWGPFKISHVKRDGQVVA